MVEKPSEESEGVVFLRDSKKESTSPWVESSEASKFPSYDWVRDEDNEIRFYPPFLWLVLLLARWNVFEAFAP